MNKNVYFLFLFFLINKIYSNETILSINIIERIKSAQFINPVIDDKNNLYIIAGNYSEEDIYVTNINYNRVILKYNSNGQLLENISFISDNVLNNPEIVFVNKYKSPYLLFYTSSSIGLFNIENKQFVYEKDIENELFQYKISLKQLDNNFYFYAYKNEDKFIIRNIILKDSEEFLLENQEINYIFLSEGSISCDITNGDELFILCIYLNKDNRMELTSFSPDYAIQKQQLIEETYITNHNHFFKILYFKDNNKFIIMNSFENNSRLRYIKYFNNKFLNQLGLISDDDNNYIDIPETQLSPLFENNDIILLGKNQLLKISTYLNDLIISIYEFYNYDSSLSIKTFKFKEIQDYSYFKNPRLHLFNNIIIVCISTLFLNQRKVGYFFMNYPKPTNIEISNNNNIEVKSLISIENNLFNFNAKIKIIEIPEDFIFYNSLNETIKEGDYLYLNDSLFLRQYRIYEKYYLKYEVISIKDFNNNSSYSEIIYPKNSKENEEKSNITIKGENGILTFNFKKCNNDFSVLEGREVICSHVSNIIEGYYLNKNNQFKKCYRNCKTCIGPYINDSYMNCINCRIGYYKTEDTNSCYDTSPLYYFLDGNIFRRCSENCTKCFKYGKKYCLECVPGFTFYVSRNSCISNSEIYDISIQRIQSKFRWIFFAIFFIAIIAGAFIVFRPLPKIELEDSRYTFQGTMERDINKRKERRESFLEMIHIKNK